MQCVIFSDTTLGRTVTHTSFRVTTEFAFVQSTHSSDVRATKNDSYDYISTRFRRPELAQCGGTLFYAFIAVPNDVFFLVFSCRLLEGKVPDCETSSVRFVRWKRLLSSLWETTVENQRPPKTDNRRTSLMLAWYVPTPLRNLEALIGAFTFVAQLGFGR